MIKIAPSILAADPLNLERDVHRAEEAGCDWLHVDVMDAHFVPNLAYTPAVVARLRETVRLPLDVHLMMDHPETLLDAFLDAGADTVTLHVEIEGDLPGMLRHIRGRGRQAGLALRPGTPLEMIQELLPMTDLVLAMTVEPGFGGQELEMPVIGKIQSLRDSGYPGWIEADGGLKEDNLGILLSAGLTVAVMGTALFHQRDLKATVSRLHAMKPGEVHG